MFRDLGAIRVEAWLLWPETAPPKGLIVHAHGNGEAIELNEEAFLAYVKNDGWAVLMPEYRGYGRSGGSPSKHAIVEDFEYFLERVLENHPALRSRLVYHGHSLGGGVVAELARRIPPHGMILESTFTSVADAARDLLRVPSFLIWDNYDVSGFLKTYTGPVLLIHGTQDEVIGHHHAERNRALARDVELLSFAGQHNSTRALNWGPYRAAISRFLEQKIP